MCIYVQAVRTYCTTDSILRHRVLLKILQQTLIQTTTVSLLQQVIGDSHGARIRNVLSVNQVSGHPIDFTSLFILFLLLITYIRF